jgi:hypothetical protein
MSFSQPERGQLKTVAVLIGYQYSSIDHGSTESNNQKSSGLPGILIDLYQAYLFALKSSPTEIAIITDIEQDQIWKETVGAMGKHIVDSGILDFIAMARQKRIYHCHKNKDWLISELIRLFDNSDRVLFYYTGHGKNGYLEIPIPDNSSHYSEGEIGITMASNLEDQTKSITMVGEEYSSLNRLTDSLINKWPNPRKISEFIEMEKIRQLCFQRANLKLEVLFIFDCCNSTGLGLTYNLRPDGVFRLVDRVPRDILSYNPVIIEDQINPGFSTPIIYDVSPYFSDEYSDNSSGLTRIIKRKRQFFTSRAICISSTAPRQESLSTSDGSLFTRFLFESLLKGETSLHEIKRVLEVGCSSFSQTANIYSTYPDLRFLWKWLYGGEKQYRTSIDIHHGLVLLTPVNGLVKD